MKLENVSLSVLKMKIILLETFCVTLLFKSMHIITLVFVVNILYFSACSPDVEFCGYSVPHPSESKIMLRIQCREKPAIEALRSGLDELKKVCDVLLNKFTDSVAAGHHEIDLNKEI